MSEENTTAKADDRFLDVQLAQELVERAAKRTSPWSTRTDCAELIRTVLQTALDAERTEHLGYAEGARPTTLAATIATAPHRGTCEVGPVPLGAPSERQGCFEPQIVPQHSLRVDDIDDAIISLHAKGLTIGEIQKHLTEVTRPRAVNLYVSVHMLRLHDILSDRSAVTCLPRAGVCASFSRLSIREDDREGKCGITAWAGENIAGGPVVGDHHIAIVS